MRYKPAEREVEAIMLTWTLRRMPLCTAWLLRPQKGLGWGILCHLWERRLLTCYQAQHPSLQEGPVAKRNWLAVLQEKSSGCRRGWNPSVRVHQTARKSLQSCRLSTGHQNLRPPGYLPKDWIPHLQPKNEEREGSKGKNKKKLSATTFETPSHPFH